MKKKIFLVVEYQDEPAYRRASAKLMETYKREGIDVKTYHELKNNQDIRKEKHYHYKTKEEHKVVRYTEILFFQKDLRKVRIYTTRGIDEFYGKVSEIISHLDMNEFIMPHRSFIVNKNRVTRASQHAIFVEGYKEEIPISRRYRKRVCAALKNINYYNQNLFIAK